MSGGGKKGVELSTVGQASNKRPHADKEQVAAFESGEVCMKEV